MPQTPDAATMRIRKPTAALLFSANGSSLHITKVWKCVYLSIGPYECERPDFGRLDPCTKAHSQAVHMVVVAHARSLAIHFGCWSA